MLKHIEYLETGGHLDRLEPPKSNMIPRAKTRRMVTKGEGLRGVADGRLSDSEGEASWGLVKKQLVKRNHKSARQGGCASSDAGENRQLIRGSEY